jgi:hypothetical protein
VYRCPFGAEKSTRRRKKHPSSLNCYLLWRRCVVVSYGRVVWSRSRQQQSKCPDGYEFEEIKIDSDVYQGLHLCSTAWCKSHHCCTLTDTSPSFKNAGNRIRLFMGPNAMKFRVMIDKEPSFLHGHDDTAWGIGRWGFIAVRRADATLPHSASRCHLQRHYTRHLQETTPRWSIGGDHKSVLAIVVVLHSQSGSLSPE